MTNTVEWPGTSLKETGMGLYGYSALAGGFFAFLAIVLCTTRNGRQADMMRLCDTIALSIKYVPPIVAGAAVGAGIVYIL